MPRTQDDIDIDALTPVIPVKRDDGYENPFDIVASPLGIMERWRANAMAMGTTGAMSALHEMYQAVRNDAAEVEARANEMEARKGLVQHLCDQIAGMQERITRLEDALEARHKADAEREAREEQERLFEEEPLSLPPGDPPGADPAIVADLNGGLHMPGGELHPVAPKEEPSSELPEPPLDGEAGGDELGDLPEELRDLPDPVEPPKGQVYPQPVAISLNKE